MVIRETSSEAAGFAERLRAALVAKARKPSPTVLEREFNLRWRGEPVSIQAVRKWLLGQAIPTLDKLGVLARWLDVSEDWLRWGVDADGTALSAQENGTHKATVLMTGGRHAPMSGSAQVDEASLVQDYRLLPNVDRQAVRAVIDALLRERNRQASASKKKT